MKVGVLTFSEADNYGAMLQAFALIQTIKSIGCDCSLIRYRNKNIWKSYNLAYPWLPDIYQDSPER